MPRSKKGVARQLNRMVLGTNALVRNSNGMPLTQCTGLFGLWLGLALLFIGQPPGHALAQSLPNRSRVSYTLITMTPRFGVKATMTSTLTLSSTLATPEPTLPPIQTVAPTPALGTLDRAALLPPPVANVPFTALGVVGTGGVDLLNQPGGARVRRLTTNTLLTATGRSAHGDWLYVQTDDHASGWVLTGKIVALDVESLPVLDATQSADIAPDTRTPTSPLTDTAKALPTLSLTPPSVTAPAQTPQPTPTPQDQATARVKATSVHINVRGGPGTTYPVIASTQAGASFTVLGRDATATWVQVTLPANANALGWIKIDLVELSIPVADLPLVEVAPALPTATPTRLPPRFRITSQSTASGEAAIPHNQAK